jgi:predicted amidohydrolase YtcJ
MHFSLISGNKMLRSHSILLVTAAFLAALTCLQAAAQQAQGAADIIVNNAAITTLDTQQPHAQALAISKGKIVAVGSNSAVRAWKGPKTVIVDAHGRRLIPGLNDSHAHYLRGGTSFNYELRWDGLTSLKTGLDMIRAQSARTPAGQWVRIVGGFTPWQFDEKRMPTPQELTAASPDRPVYIQYFYSVVVMNRKALEMLKIDKDTKAPDGTSIEKDANGEPTGNFYATPSPALFYSLLAQLPKPTEAEAENGELQLFHTLAKYGLTSVIDAGGGGFSYPGDYQAPIAMVKAGKLPLRVSFYLFTQHPGKELQDYETWTSENHVGQNLDDFREHGLELGGAGEWVLWKAGDFENFRSDRPTQDARMEAELKPILQLFIKHRWPFRIHATYDESISRLLNVIESVNKETPLNGLRWSFEHAETVSDANLDRIRQLGGGVAVQDRMYFLGDDFVKRYGTEAAAHAPPLRALLDKGIPTGMGTDATRSSFNPWVGLSFLVTGKSASGATLLSRENRLSREEALRLYSQGSAWFSQEETHKGRIAVGQFADFALLSKDFMTVPESAIQSIESVLTVVGGKPVYADAEYGKLVVDALPVAVPAWSPVRSFPAYRPGH